MHDDVTGPLPWQHERWDQLRQAFLRERLGHALLLTGAPGTGRNAFADALAQQLLCLQPGAAGACGRCKSCELSAAGAHADLIRVFPEAQGKAIGVDAVRALLSFANKTSALGARKVVIVSPLEAMTASALNAFLKVLEEPPAGTYFLLVYATGHRIPATVRSRCHAVALPSPHEAAAAEWLDSRLGAVDSGALADSKAFLALAAGRPLIALDYARAGTGAELQAVAGAVSELASGQRSAASLLVDAGRVQPADLLDLLQRALQRLLRARAKRGQRQELAPGLQALARIDELRAALRSGSNPNVELLRFAALEAFANGCEAGNADANIGAN